MKNLHFRYEMELQLDQDVWDHHFLIRCKPAENDSQRCQDYRYRIHPADTVTEVWDGFGNHGYAGAVRKPHRLLQVEAEGTVLVDRESHWGRQSENLQENRPKDLQKDREFCHPMYRFPSVYTMPDDAMGQFLRQAEAEYGNRITSQEGLTFLMNRLYGRFVYAPGVTNVKTTASEAFAGSQGVCQDYAHVFISLCRLAGVPARYVAGMMLGEGATHAWVEVWLDGCWRDMDPTNNRLVDETYIKLTHGRDFADGAVDKGCFHGFANQMQQIFVKVDEIV